jgi:ribose-phosphate pyrophosphokinase
MLVFSGSSNTSLARKIAKDLGKDLSKLEIITFPDKENRVRVIDEVLDQDVILVQSTGVSPNRYYMELFFILDSLKRSGARSITLVIPYLGYQRQDHIFRSGEAVSLEVIIRLIEELGVDHVISFDFHSIKIPQIFTVPVKHLSALPVFAEEIKKMDKSDLILVSPDMGGISRIKKLAELVGNVDFVAIEKNRDLNTGDIESVKIHGDVKKKAIMVDDVISTGKTLISAAELLKKNGAEEVHVFATHGVFAGDASIALQNSIIETVTVSDSIEVRANKRFDKLRVISVAPLITAELK